MGNEQSAPQMSLDLAGREQFRTALNSVDEEELDRRREALRNKRRKINHSAGHENRRPEKPTSGTAEMPLALDDHLTFASPARIVKQEDTSEDERPLAKTSRSRTAELPMYTSQTEDVYSNDENDGDDNIPLASHGKMLVRSSKRDPAPIKTIRTETNILKDWSPRKERAEKALSPTLGQPTSSRASQSKVKTEPTLGDIKIPKKVQASFSRPGDPQVVANASSNMPPEWYQKLSKSKGRSKDARLANTDAALASLKGYVRKDDPQNVRKMLHNLIFMDVTGQLLRDNLMLSNDNGLPQVFKGALGSNFDWPYDIKADALELYTKWCRSDFETDIMRGIKTATKNEKGGDSIDARFKAVPWKCHGDNHLVNGQWWPTQLCTLRDGAHGAAQGGIAGARGHGAFSVIVSGGLDSENKPYPDEDHGNWLQYCGTDSKDGVSTNTAFLLENQENHKPVRLIRSHNAKGKWAPQLGFRYDGLYSVKSAKILDASKNRHQFYLERLPNQDPIRGGDGPEARPTEQEIKAYKDHKRLLGRA